MGEEVTGKESFNSLCICLFVGDAQRIRIVGIVAVNYGKITINCTGHNNKKLGLFSIYCTIFITILVCIFCFLLCNLITGPENDVIFASLSSCQKSTYIGSISVSFG